MASDEKKVVDTADKKPAKKRRNIFVRMGSRIARWFREMRSELKKVVWPTPKQTLNNCLVVLVVMVVAAVVIWGFDELAQFVVRALISIGG